MINFWYFSLLFLVAGRCFAAGHGGELCQGESETIACIQGESSLPLKLSTNESQEFYKWAWLYDKAQKKIMLINSEVDSKKGMLRFLRDDFVDRGESRPWYENELEKLKKDFLALKEVSKQVQKYTKRVNECWKNCSPQMRNDNYDKQQYFQKLKVALLSSQPILASPNIEEIIIDENPSDHKLKASLAIAYSNYLSALVKSKQRAQDFIRDEKSQYRFVKTKKSNHARKSQDNFIEMIGYKNKPSSQLIDILSEVDWNLETTNSQTKGVACFFFKAQENYLKKEENTKLAKDITLTALPFIAGPAFRIGVWGLRGAGLLKWGMREELAGSITKGVVGLSSGAYFSQALVDLPSRARECDQQLQKFITTEEKRHYFNYNNCIEDLNTDNLLLSLELGATTIGGVGSSIKAIRQLKSYDRGEKLYLVKDFDELNNYISSKKITRRNYGESGFKLELESSDFYLYNLGSSSKQLNTMSDKYWNFVGSTYAKRLNLSKQEIESFVDSSKKMAERTSVIVSTKKNSRDEFRGGVALVSAKNEKELLPFEKATGIRVERPKSGSITEIVRLTVDESLKDRKLTAQLLSPIMTTLKSDAQIRSVYVYTSKSHQRLYQRLLKKEGLAFETINDLERDVVMKISIK